MVWGRRRRKALSPRSLAQIEALIVPEDPDTVAQREYLMEQIDALRPGVRALLNEYGTNIVGAMIADGYETVRDLKQPLESWRRKRQEEWLATDYITEKVGSAFRAALARKVI